jgi:predicted small integral membrane protein
MLVIRLAKVVMIAALAAFAFLVTYDNIIDYGSNYQFVQHVLSMDTTFPDNTLKSRAITDPRLWQAAYAAIIGAEGVTCLLLAIGALALLARLRAGAEAFNRAKVWAVAGLTLGRLRLVLRLSGCGRGLFRHVAIAQLERARVCLPLHHGNSRRADLSDVARPGQIMDAPEL